MKLEETQLIPGQINPKNSTANPGTLVSSADSKRARLMIQTEDTQLVPAQVNPKTNTKKVIFASNNPRKPSISQPITKGQDRCNNRNPRNGSNSLKGVRIEEIRMDQNQ